MENISDPSTRILLSNEIEDVSINEFLPLVILMENGSIQPTAYLLKNIHKFLMEACPSNTDEELQSSPPPQF